MTPAPIAATTAGLVRGERLPDVLRFRGIPFAAPPVGGLRLQPPAPPLPWTGVADADAFAEPPRQRMLGPGGQLTGSEDCLYLNVWTPGTDRADRPVLLWFYGGGFEGGDTAQPRLDGAALARLGNLVVVTAAYRVGALGWLHLGDRGERWRQSSNLGLQDQAAALRWVADNAVAFGGDPGRITVAGESAGAFSVAALLAVPEARRRMSGVACFSGSTARVFAADVARDIADRLLSTLGTARRPEDLLSLPVDDIVAAQGEVIDRDIGRRNGPGGRSWGVVHDGLVLPELPEATIAVGAAAAIPVLLGSTDDEVRLFRRVVPGFDPPDLTTLEAEMSARVPGGSAAALISGYAALLGTEDPGALRERLLTDAIYRLPSTGMADAVATAGGTAYVYRFGCVVDERFGSFHSSDVSFLFNTLSAPDMLLSLDGDAELQRLADEMSGWFIRFIRTGEPGWPAWDQPRRAAMRADRHSSVVEDPDGAAREIWAGAAAPHPASEATSR